jgi:hypothetical protein
MPRARTAFVLLAIAVACACGGAPAAPPPATALAVPTAIEPPPAPPAPRLVLHAQTPQNLRGHMRIAAGEQLVVGQRGERWLLDEATTVARPSTIALPEDLDAVTRSRTGTIFFAGTSGTVYAATDPLGPIGTARRPPKPTRWVAAGDGAIVAIDRDGAIVRTIDGGVTWTTVVASDPNAMFLELAMNDAGLGLALGIPQRVLATDDAGATWRPVATPGFGAVRVHVTLAGAVLLEGTKGFATLEGGPLRLTKLARPFDDVQKELGIKLAKPKTRRLDHTLSLASLARTDRIAGPALEGDRAWAVVRSEENKPVLARSALGEEPEIVTLETIKDPPAGVAARGRFVALAATGRGTEVTYFTSDDDGASWREAGKGDGHDHRVWVSGSGAVFAPVACNGKQSGCGALVRFAGDEAKDVLAADGAVESMAFDDARNRVYALVSGRTWELHVSTDGGATFATVDRPPGEIEPIVSRDLESALSLDDDGTLRVVLRLRKAGNPYVLLARSGSGAWEPPRELALAALAMTGRRGLAYDEWGSLLETLDGGASFSRIADAERPLELRDRRSFFAAPPICGAAGCVIDERLTRVGWSAAPSGPPATLEPTPELVSGSTLACKLEREWVPLGRAGMPNIDDHIPGSAVRFQVSHVDRATGAVGAWIWRESPTGLVLEDKPLLGAAPRDVASDSFAELGIVGALRFAFKREPVAKGLTNVRGAIKPQPVDAELAWIDVESGKIRRQKLPRAKLVDPAKDLETLETGVTIANGYEAVRKDGIYVRPFAISSTGGPLWFVGYDGKIDAMTWPETKGAPNQDYDPVAEISRSSGRAVILHGRRDGMQLETFWWNAATKDWDTRTWGGWPGLLLGIGAEVWWGAGRRGHEPTARIGMTGTHAIPAGQWITTLGAPSNDPEFVAFKGQASLSDPPRVCTGKSDQAYSSSHAHGAGHPVVVEGEQSPIVLYTTYALMRSDAEPCAYAYDARTPKKSGALEHRAFFLLSDLAHSAIFRKDEATKEVSYRPMSCAWDRRDVPRELEHVSGYRKHPTRPY